MAAAGVAEQQQIARRAGHRDRVGEAELAGLFHDEQVQRCRGDTTLVGEVPRGAADHATVVLGDERRVGLLVDLLPRGVRGLLLAHPRAVDTGREDSAEEVLHDRVRLGDDPDPPAVLVDQPGDDLGGGERLAGAGRAVHREVGRVEIEQRGRDVVDDGTGIGQRGAAAGARCPPQQQVGHRAGTQPRQRIGDIGGGDGDRVRQRPSTDRRARRQGERNLAEHVAVLWVPLDHGHLGGGVDGVAVDHRDGGEAAPVGVVGQAGRCGRVIERVHLAVQVTVGDLTAKKDAALRFSRPRRLMPVLDDVVVVDQEHPAAVGPLLHGIVHPVEVPHQNGLSSRW